MQLNSIVFNGTIHIQMSDTNKHQKKSLQMQTLTLCVYDP